MLRCAIRYFLLATFLITVAHSIIPHHHYDAVVYHQVTPHTSGDHNCTDLDSHCVSCCETQDNAGHPQHCQFKTEEFTNKYHNLVVSVYAITITNVEIPNLDEEKPYNQPEQFPAKPHDGSCRSASLRAPPIFA